MIAGFLFGVAALFLLLGLHSYLTYPLTLLAIRRLNGARPVVPRDGTADNDPTFAICMCAYNEEATIRDKIANLI